MHIISSLLTNFSHFCTNKYRPGLVNWLIVAFWWNFCRFFREKNSINMHVLEERDKKGRGKEILFKLCQVY